MDASVFRAVVLMSMRVLAIAQADINPSYTNAVPNGNTLGQVDDVSDLSNINNVVPNERVLQSYNGAPMPNGAQNFRLNWTSAGENRTVARALLQSNR
ncbi:hypothetical protein L3X38_021937 [Prunus dulcis]|uniref:Uncharacterized protein n=1 Tax=Prunus dulcis TaxID=3755 RepID=A0AAD4VVZ9_PRUDU|nr:hypothetical protein L3X38_021937 [Prunus dulcis]